MKIYGIYGASGFGRGVMPVLRQQLQSTNSTKEYELVFIDDAPSCDLINGHRVLNYQQFLKQKVDVKYVTIAIANSVIREKLVNQCLADNLKFLKIKSSNAITMDDCEIGEGSILCPFVTLTSNIKIGKHFHANLYSYVEHDCIIGDFVTFAPSVKCNGNIVIEDHAYIGTGAILRQGKPNDPLIIGRSAVVGMGAVVTKNVPAGTAVVGNPARPLIK